MPAIRVLLVGGGYEEDALRRQAEEAGIADELASGVEIANTALDNGAAERALETLVRVSSAARDAEMKAQA